MIRSICVTFWMRSNRLKYILRMYPTTPFAMTDRKSQTLAPDESGCADREGPGHPTWPVVLDARSVNTPTCSTCSAACILAEWRVIVSVSRWGEKPGEITRQIPICRGPVADFAAYLIDFVSNERDAGKRGSELYEAFSRLREQIRLVRIP